MNGFHNRSQEKAKPFQDELFTSLTGLGFTVATNGTEHTNPTFTARLHRSTDQTSLAVRYQPDGVACIGNTPRSFYVEAKAGNSIEREAWIQYGKLTAAGNIVVIVFNVGGKAFNFYENIKLLDGQETVNKFPADKRFPVIDGWVYPRLSERWNGDVKYTAQQASGTPYREVDTGSLYPFPVFRNVILKRLTER